MSALRYHSSKPHGSWKPPVGSAAHDYKWGRVLPMEAPRKSLFKALRDAWRVS